MPGPAPKPGPQGNVTESSFAVSVLNKLGINDTPANLAMMVGWIRAEGGHWHNSAKYNPLNTSLEWKGSVSAGLQNKGIQAYQSWTDGIDATVSTINEAKYAKVRAALNGSDKTAFINALVASPWNAGNKAAYRNLLTSTIEGATEQTANAYSANPLQGVTSIIPNPVKDVADKVLGFAEKAGISVGVFLLGIVMIVLGIVVLALSNKTVRTAAEIAAPTPGGKLKLLSKAGGAAKTSRALTPEVISARETAKTAAMADRARILGEIRKANTSKAKPPSLTPADEGHPLHHLYQRGRVREAGGVGPKMGHAEIMERLRAGAAKVASEQR